MPPHPQGEGKGKTEGKEVKQGGREKGREEERRRRGGEDQMDKKGKLVPCCVCAFVELTCLRGRRKVGKMREGRDKEREGQGEGGRKQKEHLF